MNIVFVLLPLSLMLAGVALAGYIWCVRKNQYSDPDGDARRMLFDD